MKGDSADGRYFHALTARPDARNTMPSRVGQPVITPQGVTDKHWTLLAADGKLNVCRAQGSHPTSEEMES